jgi:hypothetical protein
MQEKVIKPDLFLDYYGVIRYQFSLVMNSVAHCKSYYEQRMVDLFSRAETDERLRDRLFLNPPVFPGVMDKIRDIANKRVFQTINILTHHDNLFIGTTVAHLYKNGFITTPTPMFIERENKSPRFHCRIIEKFQCCSWIDSIIFINSENSKVPFMNLVSDKYLLIDDRITTIKKIPDNQGGIWAQYLWEDDQREYSEIKRKNIMRCENFHAMEFITLTNFVKSII